MLGMALLVTLYCRKWRKLPVSSPEVKELGMPNYHIPVHSLRSSETILSSRFIDTEAGQHSEQENSSTCSNYRTSSSHQTESGADTHKEISNRGSFLVSGLMVGDLSDEFNSEEVPI